MDLEKKLEIVDNYVKDIKQYLHYGLEEGRANGSEGEDLMEHFKIMAESFKKVVRIEEKLGIGLDDLSEAFAIIKEKRVNVYWLLVCFREGGLKRYNDYLDRLYLPEYHLTQEKFDLLSEVLE